MSTTLRLPELRLVAGAVRASRCREIFASRTKGLSPAAKAGIRYQQRVARELSAHCARGRAMRLETTPWFNYNDTLGSAYCSPDFLLWPHDAAEDRVIIVEVKLTWVYLAAVKLLELYIPVVEAALEVDAQPLVIVRNVTRDSPPAKHTLTEALASPHRLLHWPDNGRLLW